MLPVIPFFDDSNDKNYNLGFEKKKCNICQGFFSFSCLSRFSYVNIFISSF